MKISRSRIYKILNSKNQSVKNINRSKELTSNDKRSRRRPQKPNLRYKSLKRGGARIEVEKNDNISRKLINEYIDTMNQYVEELMTPTGKPILTGTATENQINDILDRTINKGIKDIVQEASQSNKNILQKLTNNIFSLFLPKSTTISTFETQLQEIVEREKIIIFLQLALYPISLQKTTKGALFIRAFNENVLDPMAIKRFDLFGAGAGMDATFEIWILSQEDILQEEFDEAQEKISKIKLHPSKPEFVELYKMLTKMVLKINTLEKTISLYAGSGGLLYIQNEEILKNQKGTNAVQFYDRQKTIMERVTRAIQDKTNKLSYNSDGTSLLVHTNAKLLDTYTEYSINNSEFEKHTKDLPSAVGGAGGEVEMQNLTPSTEAKPSEDAPVGEEEKPPSSPGEVEMQNLNSSGEAKSSEDAPSGEEEEKPPSSPGEVEMQNRNSSEEAKSSEDAPVGEEEEKPPLATGEMNDELDTNIPSYSGNSVSIDDLANSSEDAPVGEEEEKPPSSPGEVEMQNRNSSEEANASEDAPSGENEEEEEKPPSSPGEVEMQNRNPSEEAKSSEDALRGENEEEKPPLATGEMNDELDTNIPSYSGNSVSIDDLNNVSTNNNSDPNDVPWRGKSLANETKTDAPIPREWNNPPQSSTMKPPSTNDAESSVSTNSTTTQLDNGDVQVTIKVIIPKNANFSVNGNAGSNIETGLNGLANDINGKSSSNASAPTPPTYDEAVGTSMPVQTGNVTPDKNTVKPAAEVKQEKPAAEVKQEGNAPAIGGKGETRRKQSKRGKGRTARTRN